MGKISNGILGPVSGKVSNVVGASWKGINYVRQYTIPANPRTEAQVSQRTAFGAVVSVARQMLSSFIHVFLTTGLVKMSGFNYFVMESLKAFNKNLGKFQQGSVLFTGNLNLPTLSTSTLTLQPRGVKWDATFIDLGSYEEDLTKILVTMCEPVTGISKTFTMSGELDPEISITFDGLGYVWEHTANKQPVIFIQIQSLNDITASYSPLLIAATL